MRFGRKTVLDTDPPKKRKKEFTDYDEYQRRLALYNDSTAAFEVSSNMEEYFDSVLGNAPGVIVQEDYGYDVNYNAVVDTKNMEDFLEFAKTPGNTLPKPKYNAPKGERYSEDGLFYTAQLFEAGGKIGIGETNTERVYYENYKPLNEKNRPVGYKTYGSSEGWKTDWDATPTSAAVVKTETGDKQFPYRYEPYGDSFLWLNKFAEPQVEPVFKGTASSSTTKPSTPQPRKKEEKIELPRKTPKLPRPSVLNQTPKLPEIYSRKLNQRTQEYIYETSAGTLRKKVGREDADFVKKNRKLIDNMRKTR